MLLSTKYIDSKPMTYYQQQKKKTHLDKNSHVYRDSRKVLPWIGGPEGTQLNDHCGIHSRSNQLSYL